MQEEVLTPASPVEFYQTVQTDKAVTLTQKLRVDVLGCHVVYYTVFDNQAYVSRSVLALARLLETVSLDLVSVAECLVFRHTIMRNATLIKEIRRIPAGCELHPNGEIYQYGRVVVPDSRCPLEEVCTAITDRLESFIYNHAGKFHINYSGLSSGKDSRILAVIQRKSDSKFEWFNIGQAMSGERNGARFFAEKIGLRQFCELEPDVDEFMKMEALRDSIRLTSGTSYAFESGLHRIPVLKMLSGYGLDKRGDKAIWMGTLGDVLLGSTYLENRENGISSAFGSPEVRHLHSLLSPDVIGAFNEYIPFYDSQPFDISCASTGRRNQITMLMTYGASHISAGSFALSGECDCMLHPFLDPEIIEMALTISDGDLQDDKVRNAILKMQGLGDLQHNQSGFGAIHGKRMLRENVSNGIEESDLATRVFSKGLVDAALSRRLPEQLTCRSGNRSRRMLGHLANRLPTFGSKRIEEKLQRVTPRLSVHRTTLTYHSILTIVVFLNLLEEMNIKVSI